MHAHAATVTVGDDGALELSMCVFENAAFLERFLKATYYVTSRVEAEKLILGVVLKANALAQGIEEEKEVQIRKLQEEKEGLALTLNASLDSYAQLNARFQPLYQNYQRVFHYTQQSAWKRLRNKAENLPFPETFL